MLRRTKFRHRIGLLVTLAALGLITVTVVTLLLGRQIERQVFAIETRYVPLIEVDRDLETLFAKIAQALEDAAAAAEDSHLDEADELVQQFLARLRAGNATIADNGGDARALEREFDTYYAIARDVSARIVAGSRVPDLTAQIEAMRSAQLTFTRHLAAATAPDRQRLAAAFARARQSQQDALWIEILVATSVLALMVLLSLRITRQTVRSLLQVSRGVERLAQGEFGHEIDVQSQDEIGDLAREANRTAVRLREYRERTQTLLEETQRQAEELRTARDTLEVRADELDRASKYKSVFLANMSHELRTPLNSIMILSQLLAANKDAVLGPKQVEFATLIHRSGEELLALINEVLDLAKVEAGKQTLAFGSLPLAELEDYLRRMFQPLAAEKHVELAVERVGELPADIRTDRSRLAQILKNLVSNAFKFTERGRVTIRIARPGPDQLAHLVAPAIPDPLVITVADTGVGIAADKHITIFEAFAQAETGTSRKFGGTGLGLTIAKQLAIRLGGELSVESAVGVGSTFSLVVPIAGPPADEVSADAIAPTPTPPAPVDAGTGTLLDGKTVLIVDDDMRNVYSLSSSLRGKNVVILTAADGQEALDELARHPDVDLVLMDVTMPGMDGHEATRRIRSQPRFEDLPIIAITARTMEGERAKCLEAGASDYLPKPVDLGHLREMLRAWIR